MIMLLLQKPQLESLLLLGKLPLEVLIHLGKQRLEVSSSVAQSLLWIPPLAAHDIVQRHYCDVSANLE